MHWRTLDLFISIEANSNVWEADFYSKNGREDNQLVLDSKKQNYLGWLWVSSPFSDKFFNLNSYLVWYYNLVISTLGGMERKQTFPKFVFLIHKWDRKNRRLFKRKRMWVIAKQSSNLNRALVLHFSSLKRVINQCLVPTACLSVRRPNTLKRNSKLSLAGTRWIYLKQNKNFFFFFRHSSRTMSQILN